MGSTDSNSPLVPFWAQPSHPEIQEVIINNEKFTSLSFSRTHLPPYAIFAQLDFPPCTKANGGATYATVQMGENEHLDLNSDLVYINHSCEPSVVRSTQIKLTKVRKFI